MWDPTAIMPDQVRLYLNKTKELFSKKSGMTEEIALRYLVSKDYNVIQALFQMQSNPVEIKESLVKQMNSAEEKCESIKYILSLE